MTDANGWTSGVPSVTSYGWIVLSETSSPLLDIGVAFTVRADDEHGIRAFDDFRGYACQDSALSPPP